MQNYFIIFNKILISFQIDKTICLYSKIQWIDNKGNLYITCNVTINNLFFIIFYTNNPQSFCDQQHKSETEHQIRQNSLNRKTYKKLYINISNLIIK